MVKAPWVNDIFLLCFSLFFFTLTLTIVSRSFSTGLSAYFDLFLVCLLFFSWENEVAIALEKDRRTCTCALRTFAFYVANSTLLFISSCLVNVFFFD